MAIVKTIIFTILVPGSATILAPYLLVSSGLAQHRCDIGLLRLAGFVPLLPGIAVYLWCAGNFAVIGKGTPAPIDPPKVLVQRGLYRLVRNPMYVGILLILAGEAVLLGSLPLAAYAGLLWLAFHLFVVSYEEPFLRKKFGSAYDEYRNHVPRWVPKVFRNPQ
jgi:protein-S-isoprenylcysteine O-methyltransferase Ste14